jgi:hypothetical protein
MKNLRIASVPPIVQGGGEQENLLINLCFSRRVLCSGLYRRVVRREPDVSEITSFIFRAEV